MQSRSGKTRFKVKTIGRFKDRKTGKILKSIKEKGGGRKPLIGKKTGGVMKAMGGKMAKGYSKGGARMMKASGGKMAKGYAIGGMLTGARAAVKGVTALRAAAKKLGYSMVPTDKLRKAASISKGRGLKNDPLLSARLERYGKVSGVNVKKTPKAKPADFLTRRASLIGRVGAAGAAGAYLGSKSKKKDTKKLSPFGKAFSTARKAGKKTFTYKGKKYTTKVKK